MTDNSIDTAQQPEVLDEDALRRRLINRIALAGIAIVALLGGLAVIDSMYVAPPAAPPKIVAPLPIVDTKPVDVAAVSSVASQAPEPPKPEAVPTLASPAEPEESASPTIPVPKGASRGPSKPALSKPAVAKTRAETEPATEASPATIPRPLTQGARGERAYVLQMGVFNNVGNAQELLARLQKSGIPAQIEARVQVGPFKTKAEADEARAKLKGLGLDAGLLLPTHR